MHGVLTWWMVDGEDVYELFFIVKTLIMFVVEGFMSHILMEYYFYQHKYQPVNLDIA